MPSKKMKNTAKPSTKSAPKSQLKNSEVAPSTPDVLVSQDDLEEMDEQAESAAHAATSGGGGNDAALAAAAGTSEMSASFKNFRHHPDMENFYRFIYENDLRHEALAIVDEIILQKQQRRLLKVAKTQSH